MDVYLLWEVLGRGADPTAMNYKWEMALDLASRLGYSDAAALLREGLDTRQLEILETRPAEVQNQGPTS